MSLDKARAVIKTLIESQLDHITRLKMFHSRTVNNKANCLHERALKFIYSNYI